MRFIHLYLIGYFVLVLGAVLALWQARGDGGQADRDARVTARPLEGRERLCRPR